MVSPVPSEPRRAFTQNQQMYGWVQNKIQQAIKTANQLVARAGLSRELLESAVDLQTRASATQQNIGTLWSRLSQGNSATAAVDPQWNALEDEVNALIDESSSLHRTVQEESEFARKAHEQVQVDREEFGKARTYHRVLSYVALALVAGMLVLAGYAINFFFGAQSQTPVAGATSDPIDRIAHIALLFGGRIAIIVGLFWSLGFLFRLHSSHAAQAVSYEDRMAGLGAVEMILQSGRRESREQVVLRMSETYLSLKENAFRTPEPQHQEPLLRVPDIEKIAGVVGKILRP